jgi:hypothetical protein
MGFGDPKYFILEINLGVPVVPSAKVIKRLNLLISKLSKNLSITIFRVVPNAKLITVKLIKSILLLTSENEKNSMPVSTWIKTIALSWRINSPLFNPKFMSINKYRKIAGTMYRARMDLLFVLFKGKIYIST